MEIDLKGKNILVTGATRGIGKAIAETLMSCGARVGVHYNSSRDIAHQMVKGTGSIALQADLSSWENSASLIDTFISRAGKMDVIVMNASIAIKSDPDKPDKEWVEDWNETLSTNLTSSAIIAKKSIFHFISQGGGIFIIISSRASFRGDTPDYMAYAASKAGLTALTKSIARGYGKKGIIAFGIAPGFTRTDMAQDFIDLYGEEYATRDLALNKMTEPGDIAPVVAFLSSGMANHATGTTIDVNAGSYVR